MKQIEISRNGLSFYFKNDEQLNTKLFYRKAHVTSKITNKKYLSDDDLINKCSQILLYKEELGCSYSPEVEKKIQQIYK